MALDSYSDALTSVLDQAGEDATDTTGDFYVAAGDALIASWRWLWAKFPWLGLRKYPPGVILTQASITTLTLTVAAAGTGVAGTLSAAPAASLSVANWFIIPTGKDYAIRVTAHTGGTTAVTLDAAPEALTTQACTLAQLDYDIASDVGVFKDYLYTQDGLPVVLLDEGDLRARYPDPPQSSWPPQHFARIGKSKIRLSSYGTARKRLEYPYNAEPANPSGSSTVALDPELRLPWIERALAMILDQKQDHGQADKHFQMSVALVDECVSADERKRRGVGSGSARVTAGAYRH